jgi:hypothetical protein
MEVIIVGKVNSTMNTSSTNEQRVPVRSLVQSRNASLVKEHLLRAIHDPLGILLAKSTVVNLLSLLIGPLRALLQHDGLSHFPLIGVLLVGGWSQIPI